MKFLFIMLSTTTVFFALLRLPPGSTESWTLGACCKHHPQRDGRGEEEQARPTGEERGYPISTSSYFEVSFSDIFTGRHWLLNGRGLSLWNLSRCEHSRRAALLKLKAMSSSSRRMDVISVLCVPHRFCFTRTTPQPLFPAHTRPLHVCIVFIAVCLRVGCRSTLLFVSSFFFVSYIQVTPSLVLSMRKFFAPHNARLEELLGRPLPENWSA